MQNPKEFQADLKALRSWTFVRGGYEVIFDYVITTPEGSFDAMLVLIGWMGLRFRQEIAALWPQSSALYATFGVKVNSGGIEINDVTYRHETENGRAVLEVAGKLVNVSSRELAVPRVRLTLTDDDQRELYHWIFSPHKTLGAGQSQPFSTRVIGLPPAAKHLQLHFASQD